MCLSRSGWTNEKFGSHGHLPEKQGEGTIDAMISVYRKLTPKARVWRGFWRTVIREQRSGIGKPEKYWAGFLT
jgi:hypothetical protein